MKALIYILMITISLSAFGHIDLNVPSIPKSMWLRITKVDLLTNEIYPSSKTIELINDNGISMPLVCVKEKKHNKLEKGSFLHYTNVLNLKVARFYIDHDLCLGFYHFIESIFEVLGPDAPIKIKLNIKMKFIEEVVLPNLNPYMDRLPNGYLKKLNKPLALLTS